MVGYPDKDHIMMLTLTHLSFDWKRHINNNIISYHMILYIVITQCQL